MFYFNIYIMKKIFFLSFLIVFIVSCKSVETTWGGFAYQVGADKLSGKYPMFLTMKQNGNKIKGTTLFFLPDDPSVYVTMQFKGTINNDVYQIKETKILDAAKIDGSWLTKDFNLRIKEEYGEQILTGDWISNTGQEGKGAIKLKKAKK